LLAIGSANADVTLHVASLPLPGETVFSTGLTISAGGKSANQAVAAARIGANVGLLAAVAEDEEGRAVLRSLTASGVDVTRIQRSSGLPTGKALIYVDSQGQNTIVVDLGANSLLDLSGLQPSDLAGTKAVLLCNETPTAVVRQGANLGHQAGATVIWNPSPWRALDASTVEHVDVIVLNEGELSQATGMHLVDAPHLLEAHKMLGVTTVVVTRGAAGALAITGDTTGSATIHRVSARKVSAVDTTGCGDAFLGALATMIARGEELYDALRLAVAVGTLAATKPGAQPSFPSLAELEHFLPEILVDETKAPRISH
jgi:ribokinase